MSSNFCLDSKTTLADLLRSSLGAPASGTRPIETTPTAQIAATTRVVAELVAEARSALTVATVAALKEASSTNLITPSNGGTTSANPIGLAAHSANVAERLQGLRNRLFLKYIGVDYEFYNVYDMRYRGGA
jgi:hypothetical protein